MVLLVLAVVFTILAMIEQDNKHTILVSEKGCCSIDIYDARSETNQYMVTWTNNLELGTDWYELVEVEYPDEDYTFEEQLQFELNWTVDEMKELCFTYHGGAFKDEE